MRLAWIPIAIARGDRASTRRFASWRGPQATDAVLYAASRGEKIRTRVPGAAATAMLRKPRGVVLRVPPLKRHETRRANLNAVGLAPDRGRTCPQRTSLPRLRPACAIGNGKASAASFGRPEIWKRPLWKRAASGSSFTR